MENEAYIQRKKPEHAPKKTLLVPVTTDKGLCGSINSAIIRDLKGIVGNDRSSYEIFCIGSKGEVALTRPFPDIFHHSIAAIHTPANWP